MPGIKDKVTSTDIEALQSQINAIPVFEGFTAVLDTGDIEVSNTTDIFEIISVPLTGILAGTPIYISAGFWAYGADSDATYLNGILLLGSSQLTKQKFELWDANANQSCHLSRFVTTTEDNEVAQLAGNMNQTGDTVTISGTSFTFGARINVLAFK